MQSALGPNEHLIGESGSRNAIGTPALILDLDRLDANIASMAEHARVHDYKLRPPAKIHKSVKIAQLQVLAGAVGPCCSTVYEAETMVSGGISDVMLFTSVVSQPKLDRLVALNSTAERFSVVVDHESNVRQLEEVARRSGRRLKVLVDFEVGGGRTGVHLQEDAIHLARIISESSNLEFAGVQGYVGNYGATPDYEERSNLSRQHLAPLHELVERLSSEGLAPDIVTGGGTGTHDIDSRLGIFTEIQAGGYVFGDVYHSKTKMRRDVESPFQNSLHVRTTVISSNHPGYVITDAGAKEINGILGPLRPVIERGGHPGDSYVIVGDDMGRIDFANATDTLPVGHVVEVLPPLAFQTMVHFQAYHCVRGDTLTDIWPIDALPNW